MISQFTGNYRFLSNFHPSPIMDESVASWLFPTVEHYYQASKAVDMDDRAMIADADTPGQAKSLGRTVRLRPDWEAVKLLVMRRALYLKFIQDTPLAAGLLSTDSQVLVEGNHWGDKFWGVDIKNGQGANWLGFLLMCRRAELRGIITS
jgi:ribA/ribD-fused uncharacterized protein